MKLKIAYILSHGRVAPSNGVVSQAITWKTGLEKLGHDVVLVNMWDKHNWNEYDIIHFFGFSQYMYEFIRGVNKINSNIVVSPILDPSVSILKMKLFSFWGLSDFRLYNANYCLRKIKNEIKKVLVRSEFESRYIQESFGFSQSQIDLVRLSYDTDKFSPDEINENRDNFCLHISLLTDERKNVERLIKAAKKYNFKLKLAGKLRSQDEVDLLSKWIGEAKNVEYIGYLTEEDMIDLYGKAKVFALPSTFEGVGIVGIEAASMGCEIAVTNIGGPKEYYSNHAMLVDPFSIDSIGKSVTKLLDKPMVNYELAQHVRNSFSEKTIMKSLVKSYKSILMI